MAEKKSITEVAVLQEEAKTKTVRNRSRGRLELYINGAAVVILPGESVQVPFDFDVPSGIGLQVK